MAEILSQAIEEKKKAVSKLVKKIINSNTVLIASTKGLPGSEFQKIKKLLRGKAEVNVAKKSIILRALSATERGALQNLKENIKADTAIFFSQEEAFKLSALLSENQTPSKAKAGDISPEDIKVEPGPTELIPGPAISELSSVGLKVAVENGKLAIKHGATIVKKGQEIDEKTASVLGKLNINPIKVGFIPIAAYDSKSDKVYVGIVINKEETFSELRTAIAKSINFAVNIGNINEKTVLYFITKAGLEAKALENLIPTSIEEKKNEETKEEKKEENQEEKADEKNEQKDQNNKEESS